MNLTLEQKNKALKIGVLLICLLIIAGTAYFAGPGSYRSNKSIVLNNTPISSASLEEKERYLEAVKRLAEERSILVISEGCAVSPLVLTTTKEGRFAIQNDDSISHTVVFENQGVNHFRFFIPAQATLDFDAYLPGVSELGTYRFNCEGAPKEAGGVLYIPSE